MPRFLHPPSTPGVNRDQVATTSMCFLEGEGDMGGVGFSSLRDTENDLPIC